MTIKISLHAARFNYLMTQTLSYLFCLLLFALIRASNNQQPGSVMITGVHSGANLHLNMCLHLQSLWYTSLIRILHCYCFTKKACKRAFKSLNRMHFSYRSKMTNYVLITLSTSRAGQARQRFQKCEIILKQKLIN